MTHSIEAKICRIKTRGKHLNDFAISLRNTNLTPELCNLVPVSSQESEQSRICLMAIDFCIWFYEYSIGIWNCFDSVLILLYDLSNCKYWLTLSVHVWVLVIFGLSNCMIWKGCVQTLYNRTTIDILVLAWDRLNNYTGFYLLMEPSISDLNIRIAIANV
jgi:hypothetical protein